MRELFSNYWIYLSVCGFLLLFTMPWMFVWRYRRNQRWLKENGRMARAKILKAWDSGLTIGASSSGGDNSNKGGSMRGINMLLEIQPQDGPAYHVKTREQLHLADMARIAPGMWVEVRIHPSKPKKVIVSQWQTSRL